MNKSKYNLISAIDIGSNLIRMTIAQINQENEIIILEDLRVSTLIGKDTFSFGKISFDTINKTCNILNGFRDLMDSYKIDCYKAISTSGIREASNRDFVLEKIMSKTGLSVEIINDSQESFLLYKSIYNDLIKIEDINSKGALIVYVGAGGVEISIFTKGKLVVTEYIKIGSLRIKELLQDLESETLDFNKIIEEYVESILKPFSRVFSTRKLGYFITLGGSIKYLLAEEFSNTDFISKKDFSNFINDFKNISENSLLDKNITRDSTPELLTPSLIIFQTILNMSSCEKIYTSLSHSLRYGIISEINDEMKNTERNIILSQDIINSIKYTGRKYKINLAHSRQVEKLSLSIFDSLCNTLNFGKKDRLYLHIAAILCEVGKYFDINDSGLQSYNIIMNERLLGISDEEVEIIANIAYYSGSVNPSNNHDSFSKLTFNKRILISKLTAILKLAISMDLSRKSKIEKLEIEEFEDHIYFYIYSSSDIVLEQWDFDLKGVFFQEVTGFIPKLIRKEIY
jgi:exopolyphosphatase/guanosine-5'-triphosphate,3'-diphosphate pyrophosphatase